VTIDSHANAEVERLLHRLAHDFLRALPDTLVGLYLYGSLVTGDFDLARSDIDLLAVLSINPVEEDLMKLEIVHAQIEDAAPVWRGRIEVTYVSQVALTSFRTQDHPMIRISPGEPIHLVVTSRHYLLGWYMARHSGVALFGRPPQQVIPPIKQTEFLQVVREHAREWKAWVHDTGGPGGQAYAVLTLCRALYTANTGRQVSKRQAALWAQSQLAEWTTLIEWALACHYEGGMDMADQDLFDKVVEFVEAMSDRVEGVFKSDRPQ